MVREMEVWEEPRRLNSSKRRRCVDHETASETASETGGGVRFQRLRGSSASDQLASATRMYAQAMERLNAARRESEEIRLDQFGSQLFSLSESLFTTPQAKEYLKLRRELEILRVRRLINQTEGADLVAPATAFSELCFIEGKNEYMRLREELDLARIRKLRARIEAAAAPAPAPALMEGR